ncbi:MAG: HD domain-containing protein [Spirochaetaceae bacterium]|nr:HD domain-containing protein [Spirochaetaceae bacterium]
MDLIEAYYIILFVLSLVLAGIYAIMWRKRFSGFITLIFLLVVIANLGYLFVYNSETLSEAIIGIKLTYFGACCINLFLLYTIINLCNLNIKKWIRLVFLALTIVVFISALTIGHSDFFYRSVSAKKIDGHLVLNKVYGPAHAYYYIQIAAFMVTMFAFTFYAIRKKNDVSRHILHHLLHSESITVFLYFCGRIFPLKYDLIPLAFIVFEIVLLLIIRRIMLYDVTDTVIDTIAKNGETGFVSFDNKFNYLGSNSVAKEIFPKLAELRVDDSAVKNTEINEQIINRIKLFISDEKKNSFFKNHKDKIYQINIDSLLDGKKKRGYILYIQDDTKDQKYISLLNKFNDRLRDEVAQKTEHIIQMHDNLVMSMATMVESRDNSTGGHIKRTSDVVKILIDEILKDEDDSALKLTPEFCHNLIKAAPMHDLGKIAVDDAILRKPGKFTAAEFETMKTHAAEGARIVHEILKGTDDLAFHLIAENVAHYHHERWDGSGYPEGLKGGDIPLEARIMAVADVYDALVSKRVYKEAMSFAQADAIMTESFGKHFDKRLEKYYDAARPLLEDYYSQAE